MSQFITTSQLSLKYRSTIKNNKCYQNFVGIILLCKYLKKNK